MVQSQAFYVRGRCACGKRYRIRNAQRGVVVTCPACGRAIPITEADIRVALAGERLIPVQEQDPGMKEAVLIDAGELSLASDGSRPGLTGGMAPQHEEAALLSGLHERPLASFDTGSADAPAPDGRRARDPSRPHGFLADLIASFYFAGKMGNALNVLATAAGCTLVWLVGFILPGPLGLIAIILAALVLLYVVQFYWSVLTQTAGGEDELPWFDADWDLWDDAFKPLIWLAAISGLCSLPAFGLYWYLPAAYPWKSYVVLGGLIAGWFFWPVAVMSVALGNTLLFVRPDWLVRCALGIGPVYLLAWLLVMPVLVGWAVLYRFHAGLAGLPLVGQAVSLYLGYVLFRMLGLLFRHFRGRFPWKF